MGNDGETISKEELDNLRNRVSDKPKVSIFKQTTDPVV